MAPYRASLDRYHVRRAATQSTRPCTATSAKASPTTCCTGYAPSSTTRRRRSSTRVIEDEVEHEAGAAADLRAVLATEPDGAAKAAHASRRMLIHMLWSGRQGAAPLARLRPPRAPGRPAPSPAGGPRQAHALLGTRTVRAQGAAGAPRDDGHRRPRPDRARDIREDGFLIVDRPVQPRTSATRSPATSRTPPSSWPSASQTTARSPTGR